ncbi:efflux RND transporter periplasmic adaptor subunit [Thermodesulfobacteriota bacterium]
MSKKISLVLFMCIALGSAQALSGDRNDGKEKGTSSDASKIVVSGKAYCSLKRAVIMPFHGVVSSVHTQSGKAVKQGDVLAKYRLGAETALELRKKISSSRISSLEMELATVEKGLSELRAKEKDLSQLVKHNMASANSLTGIRNDIELLGKKRDLIFQRLPLERSLEKQTKSVLGQQLGTSVSLGRGLHSGTLVAPINGHVVWVAHELREGSELRPKKAVFFVGVMDPMLMYTSVYEKEVVRLKVGDPAEIEIESLSNQKFSGKVSRISWTPLSNDPKNPAYYEVELEVPNKDFALREGFKGKIIFGKTKKSGSD